MKKLFLVAAALFIGGATYAQTSSTGTTKFGLKAGVNLPKYKYENNDGSSTDTKTSTGFHLTGYADIPVATGLSIQPGISLQNKGAKLYGSDNLEVTEDVMSIDIPFNLVGNIPAGPGHFFIGAGPYVGFNVSGKQKFSGSGTFLGVPITANGESDLEIGNSSDDHLKAVDFGLNGLAGYQFSSGFNISAGYGLGLSNLYPGSDTNDDVKKNNRILSFSVGFAF